MYQEAHSILKRIKKDNPALIDYAVCGGEVLSEIKKIYPKSYTFGVDLVPDTVKTLKTIGIDGAVADLENTFLSDKKFDIALAGEIIEHLLLPDNMLYSINSNLNDNGYLILSFPNSAHFISIIMQWILDLPPYLGARYRSVHIRNYTYRIIKLLLQAHGFKIVKRLGTEIPYLPDFMSAFSRVFPRLGRHIIVVARKVAPPNKKLIEDTSVIGDAGRLVDFLKKNKQWK
jgi:SAM-dependent methyltransferase